MFIGITGLHGSGKTYFSNNIPTKYGFLVYYKNDIIADIYNHVDNWEELYRKEYRTNPYNLIKNILSRLPLEEDILLDAVHNNREWNIIKSIIPNAKLILVTTPREIRVSRRIQNTQKDEKRIQYWHNVNKDNTVDCLLTQISWSFNGNASIENNQRNFEEFLEYAKKEEKEYIQNQLKELIKEEQNIDNKLQTARELLSQYKNTQLNKVRE